MIDNGILAQVLGEYIAQGSAQLPQPGPGLVGSTERAVELDDVPDLGRVRITYRLNTYKHGKSRHWHWLAVHAEALDEKAPPAEASGA